MHLLPCHRLPCSCILRLSPFRLSDLCNAVALEKPSTLVDDIHVSMLRLLLAEAAISAVQVPWGRVSGANLDSVTWPETLRRYILMRHGWTGDETIINAANSLESYEYYALKLQTKALLLSLLLNDILESEGFRREMDVREENLDYEVDDDENDLCEVCGDGGNLICCDGCPRAYHCKCIGVRESQLPEVWHCPECSVVTPEVQNQMRVDTLVVGKNGTHLWSVGGYLIHSYELEAAEGEDAEDLEIQFTHCKSTEDIEAIKIELKPAQLRRKDLQKVLGEPIPDDSKFGKFHQYLNHYRNAASKYYYAAALSGKNLPAAIAVKDRAADWNGTVSHYSFRSHLGTVIGQVVHMGRQLNGLLEGARIGVCVFRVVCLSFFVQAAGQMTQRCTRTGCLRFEKRVGCRISRSVRYYSWS